MVVVVVVVVTVVVVVVIMLLLVMAIAMAAAAVAARAAVAAWISHLNAAHILRIVVVDPDLVLTLDQLGMLVGLRNSRGSQWYG